MWLVWAPKGCSHNATSVWISAKVFLEWISNVVTTEFCSSKAQWPIPNVPGIHQKSGKILEYSQNSVCEIWSHNHTQNICVWVECLCVTCVCSKGCSHNTTSVWIFVKVFLEWSSNVVTTKFCFLKAQLPIPNVPGIYQKSDKILEYFQNSVCEF